MENLNVSMTPDYSMQVITASQYDVGRRIEISLTTASGEAYTIQTDATIVIQGTKPSGLGFTVSGIADGAKVVFVSTEEMTDEFGRIPCEVVITAGGNRIGSANMILDVEESPHKTGTTDGKAEELISEITLLVESAENAETGAIGAYNDALVQAQHASADADRAERAADRAEGISGISLIGDVRFMDGGFTTTGAIFDDLRDAADRAVTDCVYPNILTISAQADSATGIYIKSYDAKGNALRVDTATIRSTPTVYTVDSNAKYIRISAQVAGAAGAEAANIKINLRQDITQVEDALVKSSIDMIRSIPTPTPYTIGSVNQVARLGWHPTAADFPPVQSIPCYAAAYDHKCRLMLADVRVTADGQYVCWHDDALTNSQIRHPDGSALTAEEKAQTISTMTLADLDQYDFGISKGAQYAGLKILRLDEFLRWCSEMNCWPVLEMKIRWTPAQIAKISRMIKKHKLQARTIIAAYYNDLDTPTAGETSPGYTFWINDLPQASMLVLSAQAAWTRALTIAQATSRAGMPTYVGHTKPAEITDAMLDAAYADNIGFFYPPDVLSETDLAAFYEAGYMDIYTLINSAWITIIDYLYKMGVAS